MGCICGLRIQCKSRYLLFSGSIIGTRDNYSDKIYSVFQYTHDLN